MATEEIKYFNVKNTSIRLVHFGGVMIAPEEVKAIVDDDLGINRATVGTDKFLEITSEEISEFESDEAMPAKKVVKSPAKTATGAAWNAKG